jgi:hypothetical protein
MKETLTIFDSRPGIGSSHPIFSSRASESGLPELQEGGSFPAKLEVIRGMSVELSERGGAPAIQRVRRRPADGPAAHSFIHFDLSRRMA